MSAILFRSQCINWGQCMKEGVYNDADNIGNSGYSWILKLASKNIDRSSQRPYDIITFDITWQSKIARFMGPTWGPPGSCRPQMGPILAPWTLLSGMQQGLHFFLKPFTWNSLGNTSWCDPGSCYLFLYLSIMYHIFMHNINTCYHLIGIISINISHQMDMI